MSIHLFLATVIWFIGSSAGDYPQLDWIACRASELEVEIDGSVISSPTRFDEVLKRKIGQTCIDAVVPGTVLQTLWKNNTFEGDPFWEDNLLKIPDISAVGSSFYTFWFRTQFIGTPNNVVIKKPLTTSPDLSINDQSDFNLLTGNTHYRLHFNGINYRSNIYFNGVYLGSTAGMFESHEYDITPYYLLGKLNALAVLVMPADYPGIPNGQQGGDHQIGKNAAMMQCTPGWDFVQRTPDRNTGIWDYVYIAAYGALKIEYPFVQTHSVTAGPTPQASVSFLCNVVNLQADPVTASIVLKYPTLTVNQSISLAPHQTLPVSIHSILSDVPLWWPFTHGTPNLINVSVSILATDGTLLASETVETGIREINILLDNQLGGWVVYVNGVRVFLQGGNWIATDQFFRYTTNQQRYDDEVRMHRDMGLNIIRVWGGSITEREHFFSATSRYGILVFQEFWMTGDNNGRWNGSYSWPLNYTTYLSNARSVILTLRNYPSLLLWCGGNELTPQQLSPPPLINAGIQALIKQFDSERFYIPSSMSGLDNYSPYYGLAVQDGPYHVLPYEEFYNRNPGLAKFKDIPIPFQPEIGRISTPVVRSMRLFMSEKTLSDFPQEGAGFGQVNPIWTWHIYQPFTWDSVDYIYMYGPPQTIDDYCIQAQLVLHEQHKSMYEGFQEHMWEYYSAHLIWKSQSPWPTLRGAFYDSYLEQNAGFFGVKKATRTIHVQWNLANDSISIVNKNYPSLSSTFKVSVEAYDFVGNIYFFKTFSVPGSSVPINSVYHSQQTVGWPSNITDDTVVLFFRFLLIDIQGGEEVLVDSNDYWRSNPMYPLNYTQLATLRQNKISIGANAQATATPLSPNSKNITVSLTLTNPLLNHIAFFIQIGVENPQSTSVDSRILPVWYSNNYINILPNEVATIDINFITGATQASQLYIEGWNILPSVVPLKV